MRPKQLVFLAVMVFPWTLVGAEAEDKPGTNQLKQSKSRSQLDKPTFGQTFMMGKGKYPKANSKGPSARTNRIKEPK